MILKKRSLLILTLGVIGIIITITTSNLLSISIVEAEDKDKVDNQLTERDIAVLCGASEDYEAHKEPCDKLYEMLKEGVIKDDPNFEYD